MEPAAPSFQTLVRSQKLVGRRSGLGLDIHRLFENSSLASETTHHTHGSKFHSTAHAFSLWFETARFHHCDVLQHNTKNWRVVLSVISRPRSKETCSRPRANCEPRREIWL